MDFNTQETFFLGNLSTSSRTTVYTYLDTTLASPSHVPASAAASSALAAESHAIMAAADTWIFVKYDARFNNKFCIYLYNLL